MAYNKKYFELIKKLLPKSKFWKLLDTKYLSSFFKALTSLPDDFRKYLDSVFLDLFPSSTRSLEMWEEQYAIINPDSDEEIRRNTIAMKWKDKGGQSAYYIQKILQENGFNVFVYENNPIVDPNSFLDRDDKQNQAIVNGITTSKEEVKDLMIVCSDIERDYVVYCNNDKNFSCGDEKAICGDYGSYAESEWYCGANRAVCGYYEGYIIYEIEEEIPTDSAYFPFLFFVGGEVERDNFGRITSMQAASIQAERLDYFKNLILSLKPAHSRAIARIKTI